MCVCEFLSLVFVFFFRMFRGSGEMLRITAFDLSDAWMFRMLYNEIGWEEMYKKIVLK